MTRFLAVAALAALTLTPASVLADDALAGGHTITKMANVGGPLDAALQGKPVVVRVHADWCPACKETASTVDHVKSTYGNRITYVQFDVTDGKTAGLAQAEAKKLHLEKFYESTKTATSTVAVIDPKTGNVIAQLYADTNIDDYTKAIDKTMTLVK